ncbi:conserved protein of unknown function [Methylorubrum extorquens]|uniref:Uncharacterized protein n=1 Tax=Methylorubrum extorquens TaxID=408 RepID=A0A2N9ATB4_METEX|nr:conserved protein of unknown function [Methylorubrum extorquens]
MVMVAAPVEVGGAVVAVMVMPLEAMAVAVPVVAMVVPVMVVVMARVVPVPLRGGRAGDQHESGGDQTCETCLHRYDLRFGVKAVSAHCFEPVLKPARSNRSANGQASEKGSPGGRVTGQ